VLKFSEKNSNAFQVIMQIKWKVDMKIGVFRPISRFISKKMQDIAIFAVEDE